MYITIDCNPQNGCEIQDSDDGKSGIIMQQIFVKNVVDKESNSLQYYEDELLNGNKVLLIFVKKQANTDRIFFGGYYIAQVGSTETLKTNEI